MDIRKTWDEFFATWKKIILEPEIFFAGFNSAEDWKRVLTFNLICGLVSGALTAVLTLFTRIEALIFHPLIVLLQTLLGGLLLFVSFRIFGGRGEVEGTIKMVGYTQAVRVFWFGPGFISVFMGLLVTVYQVWLLVVGGRAVHGLDTGKSALAVLIPTLIFGFVGLIFFVVAVLAWLFSGI